MIRRLRRPLKALGGLLFFVFVLAACSSDGFPTGYNDQVDEATGLSNVEANWLEGCEVGLGDSELAEPANTVCECSYQKISGADGIAFDDFVLLNEELQSDPAKLTEATNENPAKQRLIEIVRECIAGG